MSSRLRDAAQDAGIAPEYTVDPTMLDAISPSGDRGGLVLGSGLQGEPLTVSALRPTATRIVVVSGLYFARQLSLRASAVGAWVVVSTGRPASWQVVQQSAGKPDEQQAPLVQIRRLAPVDLPRPSEDAPLLVMLDGGPTPQDLFPPRSAWQTTVYMLPYLHPQAGAIANAADLVLMQRLPAGQAELAARLWQLPPQMARQLTTLKDDQIIALGANLWRPFRLVTTPKEQQLLGPVRRGD